MTKINLNIPKEAFNEVYLPHLFANGRYEVYYGGAGSGKSVFVAQKLVAKACMSVRKVMVCRKVGRTLRDSVFEEVKNCLSLWGLLPYCRVNKTDMTILLPNGSLFLFKGLDDTEKVKSIHGITDIWIEEASETEQNDFTQLDLRLRGSNILYPQVFLTFNPVLSTHWVKKAMVDDPKGLVLKTTYRDNRFLDDNYKEVLEGLREQNSYFYSVYGLGDWGVLGELILTDVVVHDYDLTIENYKNVTFGLDWGFIEPSAMICTGLREGEIYILDEFKAAKLTNTELADRLEVSNEYIRSLPCIGDSAEPDRIREFSQRGFKITGAKKGKHYKKFAIDTLRRHRIHVHPSFIETRNEIESWQYQKDKAGNVLEFPVEYNDHLMDALVYSTEHLRTGSRKVVAGEHPGWS